MTLIDWMTRTQIEAGVKVGMQRVLGTELPKLLDRHLPGIIEAHLRKRFANEPDLPLTPLGFEWAFYLAINRFWRDIDRNTSRRWLHDYLDGSRIGDPRDSWTPADAAALARQYVEEFGE